MSYDVYVSCHTCGNDLMYGNTNMTSNCVPVWKEVGCPINEWDGKIGYTVLPNLQSAIQTLRDLDDYDKPRFEKLVRGDGSWGTLEHATEYLERIRNAICREPLATIHVSY